MVRVGVKSTLAAQWARLFIWKFLAAISSFCLPVSNMQISTRSLALPVHPIDPIVLRGPLTIRHYFRQTSY
jgi:hypothetical protein